jgi:hypothetical protein
MCNEELANNITPAEYHYLESLQEQRVDYLALNLD